MLQSLGVLVAGIVIAAAHGRAEAAPQGAGTMNVEIRVKAKAFTVGDDVPIEVTLTNNGKVAFPYSREAIDRLDDLDFVVTDASGAPLPPVGRPPFRSFERHGPALVVAPGKSLTTTAHLGYSVKLRQPGKLRVVAELKVEGLFHPDELVVRSQPITVVLTPTTDQELEARIHALDKALETAKTYDERSAIVRKLTFIGRLDAARSLFTSLYTFEDSGPVIGAFRFYVDIPADFRQVFMTSVATRGLVSGMQYFLTVLDPPATPDELYTIITAALASGRDGWEQEGAAWAAIYPDDRYIPKLIELASGPREVRWSAIRALAQNRTDEGVACMRRALAQPDTTLQLTVTNAAKTAYLAQHQHRSGHRLKAADFPEVPESAIAAPPITLEARVDAHVSGAQTIWDPNWKPLSFDATHLVVSSPAQFKGKELFIIHDGTAPPSPATWPLHQTVHFELSRYYLEHEVNPYEGAVSGLRVIHAP